MDGGAVGINQDLEAGAVALHVFNVVEHTRRTHVLFILAPVLFPFPHIIESGNKLFAYNAFDSLFAAVADEFDRFNVRAGKRTR
jgi:hypothetical protein